MGFIDAALPADIDDRVIFVRKRYFGRLDVRFFYAALRADGKLSAVGSLKVRELDELDHRIVIAARSAARRKIRHRRHGACLHRAHNLHNAEDTDDGDDRDRAKDHPGR